MFSFSVRTASLRKALPLRALWPLAVLSLAVACSSSPTSTPFPQGPEVSVIVVTSDHGVGSNRVVFGLVDRDGAPVRSPEVQVRALYLPPGEGEAELRDTAAADFQRWPVAAQGVFTANLEFDEAGHWEIQVDTATADGKAVTARGATQVRPETSTPAIGQPAPASMTPTGDQVDDLAAITSSPQPDPGLYRLSVHEALGAGKPLVLAFATPAFCLTATCGPQVAIMSQLKDRYPERANFIHVEVFENPHLMEEGRPSGGLVKAVSEWNLPTEPWTFVMDRDGIVRAKFEAFVTLGELEQALENVLGG